MNEKVRVILKRNALAVTQVLNERVYLNCSNCGASVSLKNGGKCVYCGSVFDLAKIDWVIEQYEIL